MKIRQNRILSIGIILVCVLFTASSGFGWNTYGVKWSDNHATMSLNLGTTWNDEAQSALYTWWNVAGSSFWFPSDSANHDHCNRGWNCLNTDGNAVEWEDFSDGVCSDPADGALAIARLNWIFSFCNTDVLFNTAHSWTTTDPGWNTGSPYHFNTVAIHEFGHVLGLDHEDRWLASMNSIYHPFPYAIHADDMGGNRSIYPAGDTITDIGVTNWKKTDGNSGTAAVLVTSPDTAAQGQTISMEVMVENYSTNPKTFNNRLYLSVDDTIDSFDTPVGTYYGASLTEASDGLWNYSVTIPANTPAGDYWLGICVDYDNQHSEWSESNNCLEAPHKITITSRPDLIIQSVELDPASPGSGANFDIIITIKNQGSAPVKSNETIQVQFWQHRATPPEPNVQDADNGCYILNGLAAGASATCTGNHPGVYSAAGTYSAYACVDRYINIKESNENNNLFGPMTVTVTDKPDLVILGIATDPVNPGAGQNTAVTVTVLNQGRAAAGAFYIDFYKALGAPPTPGQYGDIYCAIDGLAAGATTTCIQTVSYSPAGSYSMYAQVDTDQQVAESSERNNVLGPATLFIVNKPDLTILSITADPASPNPGQNTNVTVTVKNQGLADAIKFFIDVYKDLSAPPKSGMYGDFYCDVPLLTPGATTTCADAFNYASAGAYNMYAQIDTDSAVDESDEGNNIFGPQPIIASAPVTVTTSPAGRQITVDGTNYTAPQTFNWTAGSPHTIAVSSPQSGGSGLQYAFSSWSDAGAQSHTITVPTSAVTYTANFTTQYQLTTTSSPAAGGSLIPNCPSGCWYNSGTPVSLTASANAGYAFANWSGSCSGTGACSVTLSAARTVTANFAAIYPITVTTSPAGRQITVDGTNYTAPQTFNWTTGSSHTIAVSSPQSGGAGIQYVFSSWSDSGAQSHTVVTPSSAATYTANFTAQYSLTTGASPSAGGSVTPNCPSGCWFNSGTPVTVTGSASAGYSFANWSGNCTGTGTCNVTMSASRSVTANFVLNPVVIGITTSPSGRQISVDGVSYTAPQAFSWTPGTTHTLSAASQQSGGTGMRYVFSSWSDGGAQSHTMTTPSSTATYVAVYTLQYQLTTSANPDYAGSVSPNCPAGCWYNSGTSVPVTNLPNTDYSFANWSGDCTSAGSCSITMNAVRSITANFCDSITFYRDADTDGYGNAAVAAQACSAPAGYVANSADCNDANASVRPNATETCNNIDDNCNGTIDEGVKNTYFRDADADSYGNLAVTTQACSVPVGYAANSTDCNDTNAAIKPGAVEVCNGVDDNCNASIDEGVKITYYRDADADGYGNLAVTTQACSAPAGYVTNSTDCNDANSAVKPGAAELCDNTDNDCDGLKDETLTRSASCGVGECSRTGNETCTAGVWGGNTCIPGTPTAEVCDSKDNNCDGLSDNGPDTDGDGVNDVCDNCRLVANPDQRDDNSADDDNLNKTGIQRYGDVCDPDYDNDGSVTLTDYAVWRQWYRQAVPPAPAYVDVDNDNIIGLSDYAAWRKYYRGVPGPGIE